MFLWIAKAFLGFVKKKKKKKKKNSVVSNQVAKNVASSRCFGPPEAQNDRK